MISEEDLAHCVDVHKTIYIVLKLCVDVEEKIGLFGVRDACWNASYSIQ